MAAGRLAWRELDIRCAMLQAVVVCYASISLSRPTRDGMGMRSKTATRGVYAFEEDEDMRKCRVNVVNKDRVLL
jgi:hypothetical protein